MSKKSSVMFSVPTDFDMPDFCIWLINVYPNPIDAPTANALLSGFFDCSFCDARDDFEEERALLFAMRQLENRARLVRLSIFARFSSLEDQMYKTQVCEGLSGQKQFLV